MKKKLSLRGAGGKRETSITCDHPHLGALYPRIKSFLEQDVSEYNMLGRRIRGYRSPDAPSIWLRDYSDMMRGFRYWEIDMKSVVDHFAEMQSERGWLFDYFTMSPEKIPCERENWAKYVRVPLEADVEFRFVKAVYLAWQSTGDHAWARSLIPAMEKALRYVYSDPWRWDPGHGLVKRAFTIDTWDFDYHAGRHPWLNFQITDETFWGIMHGDNSGYYEACRLLARICRSLRHERRAREWEAFADGVRRRANRFCFNGTFYRHRIPLKRVRRRGMESERRLTLSNPMNINRGMATHEMAVSILREYMKRSRTTRAFAEWFSVDPPFPSGIFGDERLIEGAYCNGGIMPLVGGEIARAAFEHGFEEYGVNILLRYEELTRDNSSYLWYFPDGNRPSPESSTSPEATPTDGWGSSAMLYALMEGLAGIVDTSTVFSTARLSPRWFDAGVDQATVSCSYGASGGYINYSYEHDRKNSRMEIVIHGNSRVELLLRIPLKARRVVVRSNGRRIGFTEQRIRSSRYVMARLVVNGTRRILVAYT